MLGAGIYPITIAEMGTYAADADQWFEAEEHERLKEFLALHPESGDVLPGTGGVRLLRWPLKPNRNGRRARVIYFFRDLNMPLYVLGLYRPGERINLNNELRATLTELADTLVAQHSKGWSLIIRRESGGLGLA